jgi:hypothetical protein
MIFGQPTADVELNDDGSDARQHGMARLPPWQGSSVASDGQ